MFVASGACKTRGVAVYSSHSEAAAGLLLHAAIPARSPLLPALTRSLRSVFVILTYPSTSKEGAARITPAPLRSR